MALEVFLEGYPEAKDVVSLIGANIAVDRNLVAMDGILCLRLQYFHDGSILIW